MSDLPVFPDGSQLSIEDRLALLEARLGVAAPLAVVPPITIGALTNVPAPGSQIAAQWAQDVTGYVVHRFPNKASLVAWAAPVGAFAVQTDLAILWQRVAGGWAQQTPWHGTGTPSAGPGSAVGFVTVNTLTIPADPGQRMAFLASHTKMDVTGSDGGSQSIQLLAGSTLLAQGDNRAQPAFASTPWNYVNIALTANVIVPPNTALTATVVHYVNTAFTSLVVANPVSNRLSAVVLPRSV